MGRKPIPWSQKKLGLHVGLTVENFRRMDPTKLVEDYVLLGLEAEGFLKENGYATLGDAQQFVKNRVDLICSTILALDAFTKKHPELRVEIERDFHELRKD